MTDPQLDPKTEEKAKYSRKDEEVEMKLLNSILLAQRANTSWYATRCANVFLQLRDTFLLMALH